MGCRLRMVDAMLRCQNVSGPTFDAGGPSQPHVGDFRVNVLAGLNSNRASQTVTQGGSTTTTTFCYDFADRLRKVDMSAGTNPYTAGFVFDAHGNVTTSGNQTLVFDGANRSHSRAEQRRVFGAPTDCFPCGDGRCRNASFTGAGDNSSIVMSTSNVVKEFVLSLAGGVSYTWRPSSLVCGCQTPMVIFATTNTTGCARRIARLTFGTVRTW